MQIAVAQLNLTVGALDANARRVLEAHQSACCAGARVTLTPELSLTGYPPQDLLLRRAFLDDCAQRLQALAAQVDQGVLLVGFPENDGEQCYNAVALLRRGKVRQIYRKQILRADDKRYFEKGCAASPVVFDEGGTRFAILCGDDLIKPGPAKAALAAGAQCGLVADARAYQIDDESAYPAWLSARAKALGLPLIVAQHVGGQDTQVFMGASMALNASGVCAQSLPPWHEALTLVRVKRGEPEVRSNQTQEPSEYHVYQALVTAVRDYVQKNGFPGVVMGLSGGIDSALVLALAVDALGPHRVRTFMLPSPYTSAMSLEDAEAMARTLGVTHHSIALAPLMDAVTKTLTPWFDGAPGALTAQNIQARLRALLLMGLSNQHNWLLLAAGNKSEAAVGYSTLYGDMAGGFAPLKDVTKAWVYRLAHYRNALGQIIPERILMRAPSAELAYGQTDQDTLPPYETLDAIIEGYVERGEDAATLLEQGVSRKHLKETLQLLAVSEYKRRQAVPGPYITAGAFGDDWRYPMTSKWRESLEKQTSEKKEAGKKVKKGE
ncbi:MAG: NAD+ synthase [Proteobacteria bacterium]|nr:NAD+ synthase [Pseudomonadota bacterium]MCL2307488.1 NAD+ synthase [Pseudomonadota bacterium]